MYERSKLLIPNPCFSMYSLDDAKNIAKNVLVKKVGVMKNEDLTLDETLVEVTK